MATKHPTHKSDFLGLKVPISCVVWGGDVLAFLVRNGIAQDLG